MCFWIDLWVKQELIGLTNLTFFLASENVRDMIRMALKELFFLKNQKIAERQGLHHQTPVERR